MRITASLLALLAATPALAGNVEPVPAAPVVLAPAPAPVAPTLTWAGGYAGGSLGFGYLDGSIDGDDIDDDGDDDDDFLDGLDLEEGGVNYGLHAGYNVQRGNVVFGPELAIFGGEAELGGSGDLDGGAAAGASVEADLDFGARLGLRGGYALGRNLVYGVLGASYLDLSIDGGDGLDDVLDGDGEIGYAAGLGYERLLTDNFSVGAQYTLHSVDGVDFGDNGEIDLDYRVIELRGSFKF